MPWKIAYYEAYRTETLARMREHRLKHNGNALHELKKRAGLGKESGAGFTLIEILVVVGIFAILASIGLFLTMDFYRSYSFRSERAVLVSVLEKARARALANTNEKKQGIYIEATKYTVFEGNDFLSHDPALDEVYQAAPSIQLTGVPLEIVFDQLTGVVASPGSVTVTQGSNSAVISVNGEGQINW